MDRELRDRWVAALRSGNYQQTKMYLHRETATKKLQPGYCCLGVLCEIENIPQILEGNLFRFQFENGNSSKTFPPPSTGLTNSEMDDLASMNDKGKSFAEIADYIEQNL